MITIDSIQVGKVVTEGEPDTRDATRRRWTSAFRKTAVSGEVSVSPTGIVGDEVADSKNHGGPEKAILCYAKLHYAAWRDEHPDLDFAGGGFGENLTIDGASEPDIHIGDRFRVGECEFQVSQPRQPCWKISRRWQLKTLTKEVAQTGRTGWYLRVLVGGRLSVGSECQLLERPNPEWSVARANDVLFGREVDRLAVHELMGLSQLSQEWKEALA